MFFSLWTGVVQYSAYQQFKAVYDRARVFFFFLFKGYSILCLICIQISLMKFLKFRGILLTFKGRKLLFSANMLVRKILIIVMHSQNCYKGVKTQIFPLIRPFFKNFIDTVRDMWICPPWVHICSSKTLVCEAALCLVQDQSIFSEEEWTNKVCYHVKYFNTPLANILTET